MTEELSPCPFCGGEAKEIDPPREGYWMGFWRVRCTGCGATMNGSNRHMNLCAWNRRAERTCRMGAPIDGEYRCGECGHLNRETYRADKGWYPPEYCAHCGAKAVDE